MSLAALTRAFTRLAARHEVMVVEGAGGLMVPLTATTTTLDLAQALNLPLVLVIGNRLGAINHALLTVEAARARGLRFIGGVINHNHVNRRHDDAIRTNPRVLRELLALPHWTVVPYLTKQNRAWKLIGTRFEQAGFFSDVQFPPLKGGGNGGIF